jgi:hypothetical protein
LFVLQVLLLLINNLIKKENDMTTEEAKVKERLVTHYQIFDGRIETYCKYQGCHWSAPWFDDQECSFESESVKIIRVNGAFDLPWFAVSLTRNELGFVSDQWYSEHEAMEALMEKILSE